MQVATSLEIPDFGCSFIVTKMKRELKEQIWLGASGQESRMHDEGEQVNRHKRYTDDMNSKHAWAGSELMKAKACPGT